MSIRYLPYVFESDSEYGGYHPAIKDTITGYTYVNTVVWTPMFELASSIANTVADEWNEAYEKQLQAELGFTIPQTDLSAN